MVCYRFELYLSLSLLLCVCGIQRDKRTSHSDQISVLGCAVEPKIAIARAQCKHTNSVGEYPLVQQFLASVGISGILPKVRSFTLCGLCVCCYCVSRETFQAKRIVFIPFAYLPGQ